MKGPLELFTGLGGEQQDLGGDMAGNLLYHSSIYLGQPPPASSTFSRQHADHRVAGTRSSCGLEYLRSSDVLHVPLRARRSGQLGHCPG